MKRVYFALLMLSLLMGCQIQPSKSLSTPVDVETQTDSSPPPSVESAVAASIEQEVTKLFGQKFIDPLTRYLEQYATDPQRAAVLPKIKNEQQQRCQTITKLYEGKAKTTANLARFKRGYHYSCPHYVAAFAEAVTRQTSTSKSSTAIEDTEDTSSSDDENSTDAALIVETDAKSLENDEKVDENSADAALIIETDAKNLENNEEATTSSTSEPENTPSLPVTKKETPTSNTPTPPIPARDMAMDDCKVLYALHNLNDALRVCSTPAEKGNALAQYYLGDIYIGLQQYAKAQTWLQKAVQQDLAVAQYSLGKLYDQGLGVKKDPAEALKWYLQAAEQNDKAAQRRIAVMYQIGIGTPRNYTHAIKWLTHLAQHDDIDAQLQLGQLYYNGEEVERNYDLAKQWFTQAAKRGVGEAQFRLGLMYTKGSGMEKDPQQAYKWFLLATNRGVVSATRYRDEAMRQLTQAERQQIQQQARQIASHYQ